MIHDSFHVTAVTCYFNGGTLILHFLLLFSTIFQQFSSSVQLTTNNTILILNSFYLAQL